MARRAGAIAPPDDWQAAPSAASFTGTTEVARSKSVRRLRRFLWNLLPPLTFVEADRLDGRLTHEEATYVMTGLRELVGEAADRVRDAEREAREADSDARATAGPDSPRLRLLGWAADNGADDLALLMLVQVLDDLPVDVSVRSKLMPSELVDVAAAEDVAVVCLVDLPPRPSSRTRYVARKLREREPRLRIMIGRWSSAEYADESVEPLMRAGASHVGQSLSDTRAAIAAMLAAAAPSNGPRA